MVFLSLISKGDAEKEMKSLSIRRKGKEAN
jgi:hypothetical protein